MKLIKELNEAANTLYVYDSGKVTELNTADDLAMARFNNKYKFDASSIYDFPVERGVRVFEFNGRTIIVSDDPNALAAEVEEKS